MRMREKLEAMVPGISENCGYPRMTLEWARRLRGVTRAILILPGAREELLELTPGSYLMMRYEEKGGFYALSFQGPAGLAKALAERYAEVGIRQGAAV